MRWRLRKALIYGLGLLLIGLSVVIYVRFMQHYRTSLTVMETIKPVRLLQAGETVRKELLRSVAIPIAAHDEMAGVRISELAGKSVLVPIGPGEELASWKLADRRIVPGSGERYYSFKTDKLQNNANLVRRGDRVDVWVEFDSPKWLMDASGARIQIGSVKVIERLLVAGVKTAEGAEVMDAGALEHVLAAVRSRSAADLARSGVEQSRAEPSGLPEVNTYIMREDVYNAYVLGGIGGRIKLALSDWNRLPDEQEEGETKLTEMYRQLQGSDIFSKEGKKAEVMVERIAGDQVAGKRDGEESMRK